MKDIKISPALLFGVISAFVNVASRDISSLSSESNKRDQWESPRKQRNKVASWSIVVVSSVANVVVSCLLCRQQEHAGLNPTESMTRALISDDNIARQSALGPVQLGYVLPLLVTPSIAGRARSQESEELK